MRLAEVVLYVRDIAGLQAFYGRVLGLRPLDAGDGWVRLDAGGAALVLRALPHELELVGAPLPRADVPCRVVFRVEDVEELRGRLEGAGVAVRAGARVEGKDPEGNVFEIVEG